MYSQRNLCSIQEYLRMSAQHIWKSLNESSVWREMWWRKINLFANIFYFQLYKKSASHSATCTNMSGPNKTREVAFHSWEGQQLTSISSLMILWSPCCIKPWTENGEICQGLQSKTLNHFGSGSTKKTQTLSENW